VVRFGLWVEGEPRSAWLPCVAEGRFAAAVVAGIPVGARVALGGRLRCTTSVELLVESLVVFDLTEPSA